jgi:hypothetical protein
MTLAMDFGALPPEINSARMYSGAGSAPLLAAASAWSGHGRGVAFDGDLPRLNRLGADQ